MLQWGRRPRTTERGRRRAKRLRRKALQWGRRPRTTERLQAPPVPVQRTRASMGPPSEDDGKVAGSRNLKGRASLQWGRRPRTTESHHRESVWRVTCLLQWGRRPRTTERFVRSCEYVPIANASMGPPSEDDGKLLPSPSAGRAGPCFNGAAVRGRRKDCGRQAGVGPGRSASMGPPSEDDGKASEIRQPVCHRKRLQWGRRPRTTER